MSRGGSDGRSHAKPWWRFSNRITFTLLVLALLQGQARAFGENPSNDFDDLGTIIDDKTDHTQTVVVTSRAQTAALDAKERRKKEELQK